MGMDLFAISLQDLLTETTWGSVAGYTLTIDTLSP